MSERGPLKVGVVGIGARGNGILRMLLQMEDVEVLGVCDTREHRLERGKKTVNEWKKQDSPTLYTTDYRDLLKLDEIEAIVNTASWASHVRIIVEAMEAGKDVAFEVGGAHSIRECWKLVEAQEKTGRKCMMMTNCCFGKTELALLNMVRQGMFGEIVHCKGGYGHDMRKAISLMVENGRYRLPNYIHRNGENYPIHALAPISKMLNINKGNRLVSLVSVASKAAGVKDYIKRHCPEDHPLQGQEYRQGDVVSTLITCAHGETIALTLDTTVPRPYSRHLGVYGTQGVFDEDGNMIYFDPEEQVEVNVKSVIGNAKEKLDEHTHQIWRDKEENEAGSMNMSAGHGGMDFLLLQAFVDCVRYDWPTPVDVYDAATWMSITVLSEESIALGGAPVTIPDFTNGAWITRKFEQTSKWSI